jgi:hypothetical protein
MTTKTGQLGQDKQNGTSGQFRKDIWARTIQKEQPDSIAGTRQSGQVSLTGQPRQVSLEWTERTGLPGDGIGVRRAVDKVAWAGQPGQGSLVRTGHLREDIWDRTTVTGQRDILDWTSWPDR